MPPRIQTLQRLGNTSLCLRPATKSCNPQFLPVTQTANLSMREKKQKAKKDPYAYAQAQQRKNANLQRRGELKKERESGWGDPTRGVLTPFVESLDSAGQESLSRVKRDGDGNPLGKQHALPTTPGMRNFNVSEAELNEVVQEAYALTKPVVGVVESQMSSSTEEDVNKQHEERHAKAVEALKRITAMDNGNGKDRYYANVRRVIDEFGRHNTDLTMAPKLQSINPSETVMPGRAGPDTGSSEVQIALLTLKIRRITNALAENRGYKDIHNKRRLRLLVHKRQKLLKYMERKERGGERWTNLLEKLGLTPATWRGEISM